MAPIRHTDGVDSKAFPVTRSGSGNPRRCPNGTANPAGEPTLPDGTDELLCRQQAPRELPIALNLRRRRYHGVRSGVRARRGGHNAEGFPFGVHLMHVLGTHERTDSGSR
jgi:hypothetical protein